MSLQHLLEVRRSVSKRTQAILALVSWTVVILAWYLVTHWKLLPPFALPKPGDVVTAFVRLWVEYDLLANVFQSWWRIAQAFFLAAVIAIPLGLLMGGFRWLHDLVNPIAEPMRSMPITAFLPAFLGLFGLDETMKIAFLWFGMFFYLLAVVVEEANRVDQALLETAFTLGANRRQVLWLMFRASFPSIFGSFRILYDIGWTYVILAEIVNARKGVGYMVEAAYKVLDFDRVYAGIIAIGIAAFLFRYILTLAERWLFPWRRVSVQVSHPAVAAMAAKAHSHAK
ncbi:putative Taurine transport system permease protein TauC [Candidatus Sulfopaludibacter sp. SbA4]|nr:putative Taurine transport system permease protein TauC [Candidatus Sulfopaludibacter sp. SbA4]